MNQRSSVFGRRTDGMQYARGMLVGLAVSLTVIWGTGWILLSWAFR